MIQLTNIKQEKLRIEITDEEYGFTYQITSDCSLITKIILPRGEILLNF